MPEIFRSNRARLPGVNVRGWLLYVLALPLLPATVFAIARGRAVPAAAAVIAFLLLLAAGTLVRRAQRDGRRFGGTFAADGRRRLALAALALGCGIADHLLVRHGLPVSLLVAGLAALGGWLAYGPDQDAAASPAAWRDLDPDVRRQLAEAHGRVQALEAVAARIRNADLAARLRRIAASAARIVERMAADPGDVRRARRFLTVYLDGAVRVSEQYERTAQENGLTALEPRFADVLDTIERVFEEQHARLLDDDVLDLDVQIEVLKHRLESEGVR